MILTNQFPWVFRPTFDSADLSLGSGISDEESFIPSAFVPYAVKALIKDDSCVIHFEYTIDEVPASAHETLTSNVTVLYGKYTKKILAFRILFDKLDILPTLLKETETSVVKPQPTIFQESLERHYELVSKVLAVIRKKLPEILRKSQEA